MNSIVALAKAHILTALRERITLFWFLVFPILLLTILTLIFDQVGQNEDVHFAVSLIHRDGSAEYALPFSASEIVDATFAALARTQETDEPPLFTLTMCPPEVPPAQFLEQELRELRRGNRAAVIVLPEAFDHTVFASIQSSANPISPSAQVELYMSQTSVASETASAIIEQVFSEIDRSILIQSGRFDETQAAGLLTDWIGQQEDEVKYVDFILPGIILMGFFTNGLFGVPGTILFNRDRKVLRRYWVTPLSVGKYLAGFGAGHLVLCVLQFVLLVSLARYAFGATIGFFSPLSVSILVLAAATFMAFGFLITSIAKTANAGMAVANILNMPMLFLSGMFFPLIGLPSFILILVYANPVIYLLESLRQSVGVQTSTLMPYPLTFLVPVLWIGVCCLVTIRRLQWDVAR